MVSSDGKRKKHPEDEFEDEEEEENFQDEELYDY